ncbi:MAG: hypothetical protein JW776_02150 [Candidatus Lokiarchaeota archaeon]|nr:hypothetical protein [Candidatus Lokiarchaeota archaeon]
MSHLVTKKKKSFRNNSSPTYMKESQIDNPMEQDHSKKHDSEILIEIEDDENHFIEQDISDLYSTKSVLSNLNKPTLIFVKKGRKRKKKHVWTIPL